MSEKKARKRMLRSIAEMMERQVRERVPGDVILVNVARMLLEVAEKWRKDRRKEETAELQKAFDAIPDPDGEGAK